MVLSLFFYTAEKPEKSRALPIEEGLYGAAGPWIHFVRQAGYSLQKMLRPIAEPGVAIAAFVADFGQLPFGDAVTVRENRPIRPDFVKTGPHRRGTGSLTMTLFVPFGDSLSGRVSTRIPCSSASLEPGDGPFHGVDDLGAGRVEAHQQPDNADRFRPAQAGQFVGTADARSKIDLIVLAHHAVRLPPTLIWHLRMHWTPRSKAC